MRDPKETLIINGVQLSKILDNHKQWVLDKQKGDRADLRDTDLRDTDLRGADLRGAYLQDADLQGADLRDAYLQDAYLRGANLRDAYLRGAKNSEFALALTTIVPEGEIVGWKKCNEGIVKLLIPAKAKRSNATGRKCRAEYAKDIAHFTFDGKSTKKNFTSSHNSRFIYKVGSIIKPDKWDDNHLNECSGGIHFFITRLEAENY